MPMPVERTLICPPRCRAGAVTPEERATVRARSPIGSKYDVPVNRESAYEILSQRTASTRATAPRQDEAAAPTKTGDKQVAESGGQLSDMLWGTKKRQGMVETMAKQAARTVGSQLGRQILRGVLGGILGGSRRS